MRAARRERGRTDGLLAGLGQDLAPAEHVAVEGRRPPEVAHVQHQVAELSNRHALTLPVASACARTPRNGSSCAVGGMPGPRWIGHVEGLGLEPGRLHQLAQRVRDRVRRRPTGAARPGRPRRVPSTGRPGSS